MDNVQLESILRETGCRRGRFRVVARDEIDEVAVGHVAIVNTDVLAGGGIHWVLFHGAPEKRGRSRTYRVIEMFDPLGLCDLKPFRHIIEKYDILVMNRGFPVQYSDETLSNTCGMHCAMVAQIICDSNGKKGLNDAMKIYDLSRTRESVSYNECVALYYMLKRFTKHARVFEKLTGCPVKE